MDPDKSSFENSKIERFKKALYSRNEDLLPKEERSSIPERNIEVPKTWGDEQSFQFTQQNMAKTSKNSFFNKFLLGSLIFFGASLAVAAFIFFGGINLISSNNLDIRIVAPSSISSGEELPIGLSVVNANRTDLEGVVLFIDYPEGSQEIDGDKVLTHEKINLGKVTKGGTAEHSIRSLLFGEKDSIKTFVFRIEYKVKGSNATFSKEKTYDVSIGSSPLLFEINYPKEINSGQEVRMVINITSNSSVVLKNSLIKVDYPYGFTYKSSSMKPLRDNSIWNIGDLKNGDKKTLEVVGVLIGQNEEEKTFKISAGVQSSDNSKDFDTNLVEESATVAIKKSFFDIQLSSSGGEAREAGQNVPIIIRWKNTLPDKIYNAKIEAKLSGSALNRTDVLVGNGGFYQSIDNLVLWDKNGEEDLAQITPSGGSQVSLTLVSIKDPATLRKIKNPHMDVHVKMTGERTDLDSSVVSSEADIVIKIISNLSLTSKTYRSIGQMVNTGPVPPKAEKETTYTVNWILTNTTNDLSGTVVKTKLPTGVSWKGEFSPLSEKITYDPDSRTVSWNVGNVSAGVGFNYSPKEVSFKVGIIPSISQVTTSPAITGDINATANDTYAGVPLNVNSRALTTEFADPTFKPADGIVVK